MHANLTRLASAFVTVTLPYNADVENTLFMSTVVVGYGFESWILLGYTRRISEDIGAKSRFSMSCIPRS